MANEVWVGPWAEANRVQDALKGAGIESAYVEGAESMPEMYRVATSDEDRAAAVRYITEHEEELRG